MKSPAVSVLSTEKASKDCIIEKCLFGKDKEKIVVQMATYYEGGNYGDLLARYIVERLSDKQVVKYLENNVYHLDSVASVLNRNEMCSNAVVWGSGFLSPQANYKIFLTKIRQWFRGKVGKPYYLAVRGPKTRYILLKAGYNCPSIFGDPALLMPALYRPSSLKKFKMGVVLHWSQEKFAEMFSGIEGVKIININRDYKYLNGFVDEIASCEFILSSSLHGLIIANAYKVPSVRLKIDRNPIATSEKKDDFKFEDYLAGLNACKVERSVADYTFHTLLLNPGEKQNAELINHVKAKATKPEFTIDVTSLALSFPFLKEKYKDREFKI